MFTDFIAITVPPSPTVRHSGQQYHIIEPAGFTILPPLPMFAHGRFYPFRQLYLFRVITSGTILPPLPMPRPGRLYRCYHFHFSAIAAPRPTPTGFYHSPNFTILAHLLVLPFRRPYQCRAMASCAYFTIFQILPFWRIFGVVANPNSFRRSRNFPSGLYVGVLPKGVKREDVRKRWRIFQV